MNITPKLCIQKSFVQLPESFRLQIRLKKTAFPTVEFSSEGWSNTISPSANVPSETTKYNEESSAAGLILC